ncbi:bifunctional precorrin-2 dehydrogenase/sirohydrochlorin ferrochelatase [Pseudodesulfovibrio sp. zrk46]|uniref:precorrin-2 dehydrogenase/sirohydrochlorin ferrochelatase family protein n=1 Tax=Pseudodesulfovibrio sp. zrk46 TaxID=2725288 RepID=UPI001448CA87|nr:bifunctional precorrin-2 dehydrogenase/sirohydrochlorin ferrochelatase [Pseudodesulfovibrio sp. zrk46]QJB57713.1 bifunctional precorrin-2 dehydrogenase/sirohydrochlorin ferrochelatase [Pseudodesulfovibrio sp. zrk46]
MQHYPLFVNLENRHCLVVGAGGVGKRKIRSLIDSGAGRVTVIDTRPADAELAHILGSGNVEFQCRPFQDQDVDGKFLVIACTSSDDVNSRIGNICNERQILCNIADDPDMGSFIVPATFQRGDLVLAVSTSGKSPAMARRIRLELEDYFGDEYAFILTIMGRLRPLMLNLGMETKHNTAVFRKLVNSKLLEALKRQDLDAAQEILNESLPQPLHANIPELLDGLV